MNERLRHIPQAKASLQPLPKARLTETSGWAFGKGVA
jgi:hypothetical protein